ncbi:hypothetical protein MASR2M29_04110 [Spirochaetota bacterium]
MIHIIHSSAREGGIKTVSESLSKSFQNKGYETGLFNMNDYGSSLFGAIKNSARQFDKKNKDDIFILQNFGPLLLGLGLDFKKYKKTINVVHTDLLTYYRSSKLLKKLFLKFVFLGLKNKPIIFVSREAEIRAKEYFKLNRTKAVYNIFGFEQNMALQILKSIFTFGSVSRLHSFKNIDLAIRVVKELNKQNIPVKLLIYGSGTEEKKLQEYVISQNCKNCIEFMGESNNLDQIYTSFDALLSFASIEGLPTVILEAINYGKPVFYTDCTSGPRELMAPKSNPLLKTRYYEKTDIGYLVKPVLASSTYSSVLTEYEKDYVDILKVFIEDVKSKAFSMKFDTKPFSEEVVIEQWLELIKGLQ